MSNTSFEKLIVTLTSFGPAGISSELARLSWFLLADLCMLTESFELLLQTCQVIVRQIF
jgi:hypothetical protein